MDGREFLHAGEERVGLPDLGDQVPGGVFHVEGDEIGEADEFARTTKELVLKRGRRDLELAERSLAVATKELAHFETVTLAQRERELQQKLRDAELERTKVGLEIEKWQLEGKLAEQKHKDRLADLAEDIQELQAVLAKESP